MDLGTFTSNKPYVRRKQKPTALTIIENQGYSSDTSKLFTSTESIRKHYFRNKFTTKTPLVQISTAKLNRFSVEDSQVDDRSTDSSEQQSAESEEANGQTETPKILHALTRHNTQSTTTASIPRTTRISLKRLFSSSARPFTTTSSISAATTPFPLTTKRIILKKPQPQGVEDTTEIKIRRKTIPYEYRDNDFTDILSGLPEHSKVVIHSGGIIQCLDQGNFPHPVSCKKFISCAKMETGKVVGWEYTCPKNLSFDPVGGMCNWSADLGCDE